MNRSVLVVDDDSMIRDFLRLALEHAGFAVDEATDGLDALEKIRQNPPDLVIMDGIMPKMDGFAACQRLRSQEATADLPIIMLSGRIEDNIQTQATSYLSKPVSYKCLIEMIHRALEVKPPALQG